MALCRALLLILFVGVLLLNLMALMRCSPYITFFGFRRGAKAEALDSSAAPKLKLIQPTLLAPKFVEKIRVVLSVSMAPNPREILDSFPREILDSFPREILDSG
jgi:hypothetical protein